MQHSFGSDYECESKPKIDVKKKIEPQGIQVDKKDQSEYANTIDSNVTNGANDRSCANMSTTGIIISPYR